MNAGQSTGAKARVAARPSGFTLIELLVTVAIVAVLATLAVPSFTEMINNNRLTAQANEMVTSIQLARMEAIKRNATISLCRSTDGATCTATAGAWSQWLTVDAANNVLRVHRVKPPVQMTSGGNLVRLSFRADGLARNATGGLLAETFTACVATTLPAQNQRQVAVQSGSRVSTATAGTGAGTCP